MEANLLTQQFEKRRTVAILDSVLALCFLIICSFTLIFLYTINTEEEELSEAFIIILTIPLILNGVHLISAIILLSITRKNQHLKKCKLWCSISKYLTAFVLMEMFILLQFQFKSLAFGIFAIQYLIRFIAIQKVKQFMESLLLRNSITASRLLASTIIPYEDIVAASANFVPNRQQTIRTARTFLNSNSNSHGIYTHNHNRHELYGRNTNTGRLIRFNDNNLSTGELHLHFQGPPPPGSRPNSRNSNVGYQSTIEIDELPPPTYSEAMRNVNVQNTAALAYQDQPPSYNEVIHKSKRARMHWLIAIHKKRYGNNSNKCGFAQTFI